MSDKSSEVCWNEEQFESTDKYQIYKDASHDRNRIERELKKQGRENKDRYDKLERDSNKRYDDLKQELGSVNVRLGRIEDWAGDLVLCTFVEASFQKLSGISTKDKGFKRTLDEVDENAISSIEKKTKFKVSEWLQSYSSVAYNDPSRNEIVHNKLPDKTLVRESLDKHKGSMAVEVISFFHVVIKEVY
jgi:hypothetical protein